jgi:hypothetical protein
LKLRIERALLFVLILGSSANLADICCEFCAISCGSEGRLAGVERGSLFPTCGLEAAGLEEGEGDHGRERVPVLSLPSSAFEVVEAELFHQLLAGLSASIWASRTVSQDDHASRRAANDRDGRADGAGRPYQRRLVQGLSRSGSRALAAAR